MLWKLRLRQRNGFLIKNVYYIDILVISIWTSFLFLKSVPSVCTKCNECILIAIPLFDNNSRSCSKNDRQEKIKISHSTKRTSRVFEATIRQLWSNYDTTQQKAWILSLIPLYTEQKSLMVLAIYNISTKPMVFISWPLMIAKVYH